MMRRLINTAAVVLWVMLMIGMPSCNTNNNAPDVESRDATFPT